MLKEKGCHFFKTQCSSHYWCLIGCCFYWTI